MIPRAHPSPHNKRHLDRLSCFAGLTIVADRRRDDATRNITTGHTYVRSTAVRPNNNNIDKLYSPQMVVTANTTIQLKTT